MGEGLSRYEGVERSPEVFLCDSRLVPPVVVDPVLVGQFRFRDMVRNQGSLLNLVLHAGSAPRPWLANYVGATWRNAPLIAYSTDDLLTGLLTRQ